MLGKKNSDLSLNLRFWCNGRPRWTPCRSTLPNLRIKSKWSKRRGKSWPKCMTSRSFPASINSTKKLVCSPPIHSCTRFLSARVLRSELAKLLYHSRKSHPKNAPYRSHSKHESTASPFCQQKLIILAQFFNKNMPKTLHIYLSLTCPKNAFNLYVYIPHLLWPNLPAILRT